VRGHSRRELCDLPPLKLDFRRDEVPGTVFEGQNKLKLVTHCLERRSNRRYLEQEYATYRALNALTDHSFRVRMLEVRYVDTEGRRRPMGRRAFLIEDDSRVAARLGYRESELDKAPTGSLEPGAITVYGLFQFMIGNTDWSLIRGRGNGPCCHNGLLLERPGAISTISTRSSTTPMPANAGSATDAAASRPSGTGWMPAASRRDQSPRSASRCAVNDAQERSSACFR
jgi:hypothetical protein